MMFACFSVITSFSFKLNGLLCFLEADLLEMMIRLCFSLFLFKLFDNSCCDHRGVLLSYVQDP